MQSRYLAIVATGAALAVAAAFPALAANADWISPANEGVTSLTTSLVTMGGGLIGLSIVGYGLWAAMTQRIDWARIWVFFVAGLLVTVGPLAMTWFIELMQKK
jgi:membrane associated rhomboid family serine protease